MSARARRAGGLGLVLLLLLAPAACGTEPEKKAASDVSDKVRVSGSVGQKPTITVSTPLKVDKSESWTEKRGGGDPVGGRAKVILQVTIADGRTGKTTVSTFDQGQRPLEVQLPDQLFPSVVQAITGKPAGSRVVTAASADDFGAQGAPQLGLKAGDPAVIVTDILSTDPTTLQDGPTGSAPAVSPKAPRLLGTAATPTGVDVAGRKLPAKLQVYTLREGTGPAIDGPHRVSVDYLGQVWGGKEPFNDSYPKEPVTFSVGTGGVVPAWDKALAGVKEGARMLLVCPPATAYGNAAQPGIPAGSTLVFVIDVLGVG